MPPIPSICAWVLLTRSFPSVLFSLFATFVSEELEVTFNFFKKFSWRLVLANLQSDFVSLRAILYYSYDSGVLSALHFRFAFFFSSQFYFISLENQRVLWRFLYLRSVFGTGAKCFVRRLFNVIFKFAPAGVDIISLYYWVSFLSLAFPFFEPFHAITYTIYYNTFYPSQGRRHDSGISREVVRVGSDRFRVWDNLVSFV